jgi:predicted transcriptional regulator YdeE/DNA-binding transcriptional MerR regulator
VDRFTRYRYYSAEQLAHLNRILVLKELGFSLEQIGQLLTDNLTPEQLKGMLRLRRAEVEQQVQAAQLQIEQIDLRLNQIEQEGKMPDYEIVIKRVPAQWIASVQGTIPSYDQSEPIFDRLFDEVAVYLSKNSARPAGPGIAIYHEMASPDVPGKVEAAIPLVRSLPGSRNVKVYCLPAEESMACVVHHGSFASIGAAYQTLLGWLQANDCRSAGPTREVYLRYQRGGDQGRYITEIQIPVKQIRKEELHMEPKIVSLEALKIVGMPYLGKNENSEIGQMWGEFIPRIPEIKHLAPGQEISYGMCYPNDQGFVDYVASLPVTELADIPHGMVGRDVPAQTYVVFESHGLSDIHHTYRQIEEWFPTSGYQPGTGPDFELYPEDFNPDDPQSLLYIYFPVKTS